MHEKLWIDFISIPLKTLIKINIQQQNSEYSKESEGQYFLICTGKLGKLREKHILILLKVRFFCC